MSDVRLLAIERVAPRIDRRLRAARGVLPFGLGRQAAAAPGGIRLRLEPGQAHPRMLRDVALAVERQACCVLAAEPRPAIGRPERLVRVAAGIDEGREGRVGDLVLVDPVALRERHLVGRLLAREFAARPSPAVICASRAAIALASVPIVNVPAGTQTCAMPEASVRSWPAVGAVGGDRGRRRASARLRLGRGRGASASLAGAVAGGAVRRVWRRTRRIRQAGRRSGTSLRGRQAAWIEVHASSNATLRSRDRPTAETGP